MSHIDGIRDWIYGVVTPTPVIIAPYNGPVPTGDYIAIQDVDSVDDDFPPVTKHAIDGDDDNILYWTQIDSELMVSVNVYAATGREIHAKLKARVNMPPVRLADDSSIRPILVSAGNVRNLSFLNDTSHAPRYQCDYTFRVAYQEEKTEPRVKRVVATGTINEGMPQEMTIEAEQSVE